MHGVHGDQLTEISKQITGEEKQLCREGVGAGRIHRKVFNAGNGIEAQLPIVVGDAAIQSHVRRQYENGAVGPGQLGLIGVLAEQWRGRR